ncbi:hypothetical protein RJ641_032940 [Dillenia turbinata]|uniref:Uncharacterized protein n=1 Tax=Dillenia turbinata TaxID=194707 RepID=A0AAN8ZIW8_9MAGN
MFGFYGDGEGDEIEEDYQGVRGNLGLRGLLSGLSLGGGRVEKAKRPTRLLERAYWSLNEFLSLKARPSSVVWA